MTFWKGHSCGDSERINGFQGLQGQEGAWGFPGQWNYYTGEYALLYICPNPLSVQQPV